MEFKVFSSDDAMIDDLEKLRCEVIGLDESKVYINSILSGKMLGVGCFYNNQLVGGAYVSNTLKSLFIDQIFVKKEYQNNSLHVGSAILMYIISNKEIFDDYFGVCFDVCRLESRNRDSFYVNLGFKKESNIFETMKKKL